MKDISNWFFRLAVAYLVAGVTLGIVMAASHNHSLFPLHAHLNLLGWVTLSLFGLFYRGFPAAAQSKLAKVHFWVYVPSHFVQMVLLGVVLSGNESVEPVLGVASILVGLAILCFAFTVWRHTQPGMAGSGIAASASAGQA